MCYARRQRSSWARIKLSKKLYFHRLAPVQIFRAVFLLFYFLSILFWVCSFLKEFSRFLSHFLCFVLSLLLFNFQGPFRSLLPPPSAFRLRPPLEERSLSISLPFPFVNPLFSIFSNFSFFRTLPFLALVLALFSSTSPFFFLKNTPFSLFCLFSSTFSFPSFSLFSPFFLPLFPLSSNTPFQKTDLPLPGRSVFCKNLFSTFFNKRLRPSAPVPGKAPQTAHKKPGLSACRWRIFQFLPWR